MALFGALLVWLWMSRVVMDLDGGQPDYYYLAAILVIVGTGCALLAYHTLKNNEEDTDTKKRIVLVGTAVAASMVTISVLYNFGIL